MSQHVNILYTFCRLQRCSQIAAGPPLRKRLIETDETLLAGIRPFVFSSTHYYLYEESNLPPSFYQNFMLIK